MRLYLGSDFFQKDLCQSDWFFGFFPQVLLGAVLPKEINCNLEQKVRSLNSGTVEFPCQISFRDNALPKAALTPGHCAKRLCHYSYHCLGLK